MDIMDFKRGLFFCLLAMFVGCDLSRMPVYDNSKMWTGTSLACYENTVVIGSSCFDGPAGRVLIMDKVGQHWKQTALFDMQKLANNYRGPCALSMSESYIAVGLQNVHYKPGAVLLIYKNSDGEWTVGNIVKTPHPKKEYTNQDCFGETLSLFDNLLVVGECTAEDKNGQIKGKAYLYHLNKADVDLIQEFSNDSDFNTSRFGSYVQIAKDKIIISDEDYEGLGCVYVYKKNFGEYSLDCEIKYSQLSDMEHFAQFGGNFLLTDYLFASNYDDKLYVFDLNCKNINQLLFKYTYNGKGYYFESFWNKNTSNYSAYGNIFRIGANIYRIEDSDVKKINSIKLICNPGEISTPSSESCMYKDLLICTDGNYDNFVDVERQKRLYDEDKKNTGAPKIKIDSPKNPGRVHILRLLSDGSYTEEAVIARRTNKKSDVEFYDMIEAGCFEEN